ncbi:MAG TPA: hypothetical protein VGQ52_13895 [Gemmatimonadaceae bacterium]|jgi:hypothetical protein|nr:hypothetical protein [Gemmatimonadaceae bacterium]
MNAEVVPWAFSIPDAARMVGMSTSQFRRVFLDTGRLRSIPSGIRDRVIDASELHAAWEQFKAEKRAEKAGAEPS